MKEQERERDATPDSGVLPVDSDVDALVPKTGHRAIHLHPGYIGLVIIGGMLGTLARYGLEAAIPTPGGWPLPTLLINLAGALALGALLEGLVRRGRETGRLRKIRLLAGTGFLGAFTTYSTLALEATMLLDTNRATAGVLYLAASLIGGVCATTAGIWVAARHHQRFVAKDLQAQPNHPTKGKRP